MACGFDSHYYRTSRVRLISAGGCVASVRSGRHTEEKNHTRSNRFRNGCAFIKRALKSNLSRPAGVWNRNPQKCDALPMARKILPLDNNSHVRHCAQPATQARGLLLFVLFPCARSHNIDTSIKRQVQPVSHPGHALLSDMTSATILLELYGM